MAFLLNKEIAFSIAFAALLAAACLLRGLVYIPSVALFTLLSSVLIAGFYTRLRRLKREPLAQLGSMALIGLLFISLLHFVWLSPPQALWQSAAGHEAFSSLTAQAAGSYDITAEYGAIGRYSFLALVFYIALAIGQSRRLSIAFMQALLALSVISIMVSFLLIAPHRFAENFSYRHGLVNPNHAAHFLAITLLLTLWQAQRWLRQFKASCPAHGSHFRWLQALQIKHLLQALFISFAILLVLSGLFLTHSRGGILAASIALLSFTLMLLTKRYAKHRRLGGILLPGLLLAGLFGLLLSPYSTMFHKTLAREGLNFADRPAIYRSSFEMVKQAPLLGTGPNSFAAAYPSYRSDEQFSEGLIDKAHSHYLEMLIEWGAIGLLLILTPIIYVLRRLLIDLRRHQKRYDLSILGLSLWLLAAIHSVYDFPLQIPAIAALHITLLTLCTCQSAQYRRHHNTLAS